MSRSRHTEASTAREKYCVLIPHPTAVAVLGVPLGEGWALPECVPHRDHPELPEARRIARAQLGLDLTIRYRLRLWEPAISGPLNVFVGEPASAGWCPTDGAVWIGQGMLDQLKMPFPRQRRVLQAWFAEAVGTPMPALDFPWWETGWLARVEAWLLPMVGRLGYTVTGSPERLKSSYTSGVVQVPATPGDLYLKVMAQPLAREATLLPILAELAPAHFPTLLATDTCEGWVLMRDMEGQSLGNDVPVEQTSGRPRALVPDQPEFQARVRDAYLQPWRAYTPMARLQAAFNLARRLRTLYAAIHQGRLIAAYQQMLGSPDYIPETPTGVSFHHLQWWLGQKLLALEQLVTATS